MADPFARHASAALIPFRRRTAREPFGQRIYDELMRRIDVLDAELSRVVEERRQTANRLTDVVGHTWPVVLAHQGYRPLQADELPMPEIRAEAEGLSGSALRSVALTLLGRYGTCQLRTLHCLLILHGYFIDSRTPVKALSDALRLEVHRRRAVRVGRGVYGLHPSFRPRRGRHGAVPLTPFVPWAPGAGEVEDLPSASAWT